MGYLPGNPYHPSKRLKFMGLNFNLLIDFSEQQQERLHNFCYDPNRKAGFDQSELVHRDTEGHIGNISSVGSRDFKPNFQTKEEGTIYKLVCLKTALELLDSLQKDPELNETKLTLLEERCSKALQKTLARETLGRALASCFHSTRMKLLTFSQLKANDQTYNNGVLDLPLEIQDTLIATLLDSDEKVKMVFNTEYRALKNCGEKKINRKHYIRDIPFRCTHPFSIALRDTQLYTLRDYLAQIKTRADYVKYMGIFYTSASLHEFKNKGKETVQNPLS